MSISLGRSGFLSWARRLIRDLPDPLTGQAPVRADLSQCLTRLARREHPLAPPMSYPPADHHPPTHAGLLNSRP